MQFVHALEQCHGNIGCCQGIATCDAALQLPSSRRQKKMKNKIKNRKKKKQDIYKKTHIACEAKLQPCRNAQDDNRMIFSSDPQHGNYTR